MSYIQLGLDYARAIETRGDCPRLLVQLAY